MQKLKNNLEKCTGCHACEQSCPTGAITVALNSDGFIYPEFDENKCINCGICEKRCHMLLDDKAELLYSEKQRTACFGWHRNAEIRAASSSGGAFTSILNVFLPDDGVVYGASFNENFNYVHHIRATKSDYGKLRKSKYVFCDPKQTFCEAQKDLKEGKKVLYTGTPCQIAGLKRFLAKDYDNLLTMDFICHGTPGIKYYNDHIEAITRGGKVDNVDFRSKANGWSQYCLKVVSEKRTYLKNIWSDFYLTHFFGNNYLRECCYDCQYSDGKHVSDVTVADFWGIKNYKPEMNDEKGISLIVFNNEKTAQMLYAPLKEIMELYDLDYDNFKYIYKPHTHYSKDDREKFMSQYRDLGYSKVKSQWNRKAWIPRLKRKIGKMLGH